MGAGVGDDGFDGDDVPEVFEHDPGDQEIDIVFGVEGAVASGSDVIALAFVAGGALDLHAEEAVSGVEEEVVGAALSPGLGDGEVEAAGLGEEGGLDGFSQALACGAADGVEGDGWWRGAGLAGAMGGVVLVVFVLVVLHKKSAAGAALDAPSVYLVFDILPKDTKSAARRLRSRHHFL